MIENPNPITATFAGMWITSLQLILPSTGKRGMLTARLLPWEGAHLLATGGKDVRILSLDQTLKTDSALATVIADIKTNLARLSGNATPLKILNVSANDPTKPITCNAMFTEGRSHIIPDCTALCGTDNAFAACFTAAMVEIAQLAGLTVD